MSKAADSGGGSAKEVDAKVQGYIDRLGESLGQCANDVEDRPDAFLWNARRSLEAMLLAVSTKAGTPKPPDMGIGKLFEQFESKEGLIDPDIRDALRSLQTAGNYGTHLQGHTSMKFWGPAERCRRSLVDAVRWFFERSNISPRAMPAAIKDALLVLEGKTPPPPRVERERAKSELARLERDREERDQLLEDLKVARDQVAALQDKPEETARTARSAAIADGEAGSRLRGNGRPAAVVAAIVLCVAVGVFGATWLKGESAGSGDAKTVQSSIHDAGRGSADPVPSGSGSAVVPIVAAIDAGGAADAGKNAAVSDAGATSDCRDGMVKLGGGSIKLGEPYPRSSWWSESKKTGLAATVPPFCIDRSQVLAKDFTLKGTAAELEPTRFKGSTCQRAGKRGKQVNCVTHDEALRHCEARGARLPRLVEWEYIASSGNKEIRDITSADHEWIEDTFPSPAWLGRALEPCDGGSCYYLVREEPLSAILPGSARYSWMRYHGNEWAGNIMFRCAKDAK
jgi:formylglycine-generating enzyme required for sulfatase activity